MSGKTIFRRKETGLLRHRPVGICFCLEQKPILLAGFYVRCFHAFFALCGVILDFLAIREGAKAFFGDIGVMDKQVLAAIIRGNESEPLLLVEPLYCPAAHIDLLGPPADHIANPSLFQAARAPREPGTALFH